MRQLGQYVVSLTAAALISGMLLAMVPEGTTQKLLRLVCGIFLTITALSALPGLKQPDLTAYLENYQQEGEALAAMGEENGRRDQLECIKQAMESYILDQAAALGADVHPDITMAEEGTVRRVVLAGRYRQDQRRTLAAILTNDLGIPEENQQWIQEN